MLFLYPGHTPAHQPSAWRHAAPSVDALSLSSTTSGTSLGGHLILESSHSPPSRTLKSMGQNLFCLKWLDNVRNAAETCTQLPRSPCITNPISSGPPTLTRCATASRHDGAVRYPRPPCWHRLIKAATYNHMYLYHIHRPHARVSLENVIDCSSGGFLIGLHPALRRFHGWRAPGACACTRAGGVNSVFPGIPGRHKALLFGQCGCKSFWAKCLWLNGGRRGVCVAVFVAEGRPADRQGRGGRYSPGARVRARRAPPLGP